MKKCIKCLENKNEFEFQKRADTGKLRNQCKVCRDEYVYQWTKKNPKKRQAILDRFSEKHKRKNCVICNTRFTPSARMNSCSIKCRLLEGREIDKKTGCWSWKFTKLKFGYGKLHVNSKDKTAHRLAYEEWIGEIPNKMLVLHKCDNPSCFNPDHLYVGDYKQNMKDRIDRNRLLKGENNPASKLTNRDVKNIRILLKEGFSQSSIARKYNVSPSCIWNIKHKKTNVSD